MPLDLGWQAWLTALVIVAMLVALIREIARPDLILLGSIGILLGAGVLSSEEAFAGFSNSALLAVGSLFVIAAGVQKTGALVFVNRILFSHSKNVRKVILRLMLPTAFISAFLNNTPVVAMLMPPVLEWSKKHGIPTSKLLIPLSYAAIIGGMTTLIGTSTNLLVSGLLQASGYEPLGMFDLTWVGLPVALVVIAYFVMIGYKILPERKSPDDVNDPQLPDCFFNVRVSERSPLAGKTVEEVKLRALKEAYLVHLKRGEHIISSAPNEILQSGDVLTFLGHLNVLDELVKRPGLEHVLESVGGGNQTTLPLYEAVVAADSQLIGRTLRDVGFRENFGGVVLGIRRKDTSITGPLARVPIRAGDLFLVEAPDGFDRKWNARRDEFYLVAPLRKGRPASRTRKAPIALIILLLVVVIAAVGVMPIVTTSFIGALAMIVFRCLSGKEARAAVDIPILVVIAAALGISKAMENSGLAAFLGNGIVSFAADLGPIVAVAAVFLATSALTELVTNNASAAIMMTIGIAAAEQLSTSPLPFAIAVAIGASASFATPIGYQTNLMVMSAGGYRFTDYLRTGCLVNLLVAIVAITLIAVVWM